MDPSPQETTLVAPWSHKWSSYLTLEGVCQEHTYINTCFFARRHF